MLRKVLILLLVLVFATGCSGREEAGEGNSDTSSASDGKAAAASWENAGTVLHPGSKIIGNTLYFIQGQRDVSTGRYADASICRKVKGMGDEEEILHMGAGELVMYLIDEEESLYCLYAEEKRDHMEFFLKKAARDGTIIYNTPVCEQEQPEGQEALSQIGSVTMGEVDRDGSICLANASGSIYLFDPDGQLVCTGIAGWDEETFLNNGCGLANAGENGIFTYQTDRDQVHLQKVNMSDGKLGAEMTVRINAEGRASADIRTGKIAEMQPLTLEIYSGYDMGIFLADSDILWRYDFSGQELIKMLEWGGSTVNLKDYMIDAVGILPDHTLFIMAHRSYEDVVFAEINYVEATEIPEKKIS